MDSTTTTPTPKQPPVQKERRFKPAAKTALTVLFVLLVIIGLYDWIKDWMRYFSGAKDIIQGNALMGGAKLYGFTKHNLIRSLAMAAIVVLMLIIAYFGTYEVTIQQESYSHY